MCRNTFDKQLMDHVSAEFIDNLRKDTEEIFNFSTDLQISKFVKLLHEELAKAINEQRNSSSCPYYILSYSSLNRKPEPLFLKKCLELSSIAPDGLLPQPRIKEQMKNISKTIYPTVAIMVKKNLPTILYSLLSDLKIDKLINKDDYFDAMLKLFKENLDFSKNTLDLKSIPKEDLVLELKLLLLNSDTTVQKPGYFLDESIIDAYYI